MTEEEACVVVHSIVRDVDLCVLVEDVASGRSSVLRGHCNSLLLRRGEPLLYVLRGDATKKQMQVGEHRVRGERGV